MIHAQRAEHAPPASEPAHLPHPSVTVAHTTPEHVAEQGAFHGIVDYTELPLVSVDFNHDPHSAIVDGTQTRASGAHPIKPV